MNETLRAVAREAIADAQLVFAIAGTALFAAVLGVAAWVAWTGELPGFVGALVAWHLPSWQWP